jgi:hypothetical protein
MGAVANFGSGTPGAFPSPDFQGAAMLADAHAKRRRWWYGAALAAALVAVPFCYPDRDLEEVVQLERLVPRIERAQALSSETRDVIARMVARQSAIVGSSGQARDMRRKLAIERATKALKAKEGSSAAGQHVSPARCLLRDMPSFCANS